MYNDADMKRAIKEANRIAAEREKLIDERMALEKDEDKHPLERGLPQFLERSIVQMKISWAKKDNGEKSYDWDCDFCQLQSDINIAEVERMISSEQAWYLREKYLRIERPC